MTFPKSLKSIINLKNKIEKSVSQVEQRLAIYRKALKHFTRVQRYYKIFGRYSSSILSDWYAVDCGFCYYFRYTQGIHLLSGSDAFENKLPELFNQKPETTAGIYWFKPDDLESRISCLRGAIIECEIKQLDARGVFSDKA